MSDFVSFVDKALTQCEGSKLKKFVLDTTYKYEFTSQFNNWIHYAIGCDVEEVNLSFSTWGFGVRFMLDQKFFTGSCFIDLTLSGCIFNPTGAISWTNLKTLCIYFDIIDEDLIENILSGSPQLEILALNYCSGYKRLDITSKSVKCLMLNSYMVPYDQFDTSVIEINAPNIIALSIEGTLMLWKLLLVNVSSLVEAELDYSYSGHYETMREAAEEEMFKGFIQKLRHVKLLSIGESCHEVLSRLIAKGFEFTSNMWFPGVTNDRYESDSTESGDCDSIESGDCDSVESGDCDSVETEDL